MPELGFQVTGVETAARGLAPLLVFKLAIRNQPEAEIIEAIMLHAQVQIASPQRSYNATEKEKLVEVFGTPERWGQTLRNHLWGHCNAAVSPFTGATETRLLMPCTFDLNVLATKYFQALEGGDIPLLFLFSGTVFYRAADGQLQVRQISWSKECAYRLGLAMWKKLMDQHFPNTAWVSMHRSLFEQLCALKRERGFTSWDETVAFLLEAREKEVAAV